MLVCLFVTDKRQNDLTNLAQILCGTSHDPKEGLWTVKIGKNGICANSKRKISQHLKWFKLKQLQAKAKSIYRKGNPWKPSRINCKINVTSIIYDLEVVRMEHLSGHLYSWQICNKWAYSRLHAITCINLDSVTWFQYNVDLAFKG